MAKFNHIEHLDNILKYVSKNDEFIKIQSVADHFINKGIKQNTNDYVEYLFSEKLIKYNYEKDKIKITIQGSAKINLGGFMRAVKNERKDLMFKWYFWIISIILSIGAIFTSIFYKKLDIPVLPTKNTIILITQDSLRYKIDTTKDKDTILFF